jgi:GLPGLI family protein
MLDVSYRDYSKKTKLDNCKYSIIYSYKFTIDTVKKEYYYDRQTLEIGEQYAHYYSIYADRIDSVDHNMLTQKTSLPNKDGSDGYNPMREANMQSNESAIYDDYWFNYPQKGMLTVEKVFFTTTYIYEENIPQFEWKLQPDTATILGYKCIKATTTFRGRNYEVWFTPFIPIRQGPWKFNGLLGLILKATDTKGYFEWMATGIEKNINKSIYNYKHNANTYKYVQREDIQKLNDKRWKDPVGLYISLGMKLFVKGSDEKTKSDIIQNPYIPQLELK